MTPARTAVTRTHTKLPREERERLLLDAAREEFGTGGYGGASLGHIAERAGVSKALILSYFGSKDGLYAACVDRATANLVPRIEHAISNPAPAGSMAMATLSAIFTGLEGRQQDWNVLNDHTVPPGDGADAARRHRRTVAGLASRGIDSLAEFGDLEDAADVQVITEVWMGAVSSVVNWWLRHPEETAAAMVARCERIVDLLFTQPRAEP